MSVLAHSNKQILWEVLNGLISENKLKISNIEDFRTFFEHKCKEYHVKRFDYGGLSDINKHIVAECFEYLKKASQESKLLMFREYEQYGNKNIVNNLQIGKRYEEHQTNFKTMINAKRPNEVDFTESTDIPIDNMDDVMTRRMKERDADLDNITNKYNQNHDSIKWLNNSGDIPPPKLVIHDENPTPILKTNYSSSKGESKEKIKKVKFKSDFLNNIDNVNESKNELDDIELKEKAKKFQELSEQMNKNDNENSKVYLEKREIIENMDKKEINEKPEANLENIFTKMKRKTATSDIEGSKKVDLIDINVRLDKLENYLVDVLKNQLDLMNQQKEILGKLQYNEKPTYNEENFQSFSAI